MAVEQPKQKKTISYTFFIISIVVFVVIIGAVFVVMNVSANRLQSDINALQSEKTALQDSYDALQQNYTQLNTRYVTLNNYYNSLSASYNSLYSNYTNLQSNTVSKTAYNQLVTQYNALSDNYNQINSRYVAETTLRIGTTLETYYDYIRANSYTLGADPLGEERWYLYPNYYSDSVIFAADEAAHDAGQAYWPTYEQATDYYTLTGEHASDTAASIIQDAITYSGVTATDSNVVKIDKILDFIHSHVAYQTRLLDHMWFPTETLTFKSGDCTSFSILAACMFEEVGIKSAIGFFTNGTLGGHAMVLVRLDNLGGYGYRYYSDLTSFDLTSGKWIIIEPQSSSLSDYSDNLDWVSYWSIVAASEVPYGA